MADHRLVFVQPAEELKIETTTDRAEYRPGGEARMRFHVTNAQGEGVQAALGLQVVDEAVFALAEKQPGFAKVFFYLEQEVMKPRYEIHSLSMASAVSNEDGSAGPCSLRRGRFSRRQRWRIRPSSTWSSAASCRRRSTRLLGAVSCGVSRSCRSRSLRSSASKSQAVKKTLT